MNKHSLLTISLLSLSFISLLSCSKNDSSKEPTVEPDAIINFPDATFKSLLSLHGKALTRDGITLIDTNNDGEIQIKEAQAYTGLLHVSGGIIGREITDLTGIEHFINITKLYAYNNKKLEKIDVSKNTQLTYLIAVGNGLTEIDITKNTALVQLHLHDNKLTQIDASKKFKS